LKMETKLKCLGIMSKDKAMNFQVPWNRNNSWETINFSRSFFPVWPIHVVHYISIFEMPISRSPYSWKILPGLCKQLLWKLLWFSTPVWLD
jgi:hypothetical protein